MNQKKECKLQDYDDFDQSIKVLEQGISATKYNYSNRKSREILIKISKDHSGLQYRTKNPIMFEIWKDIKFTDLNGLLYGGVSMTFKA